MRTDTRDGRTAPGSTLPSRHWDPVPHFVNAATMGLPPRAATEAMHRAVDQWASGGACPARYDLVVNRSRDAYARLVGVPASWVATGSQASVMAGAVAASLPDGAEVVCVAGDFSSIVHPFLAQADRGVRVRQVPLAALADAVGPGTHLVSFSLVQSADGALADADAVRAAAREHGALTLCDITQAGWMPVDAAAFDITVCSAYKWWCQPRGVAYQTVRPEVVDRLRPVNAGWYAGASIWDAVYTGELDPAPGARRFDVSPAWLCWEGAAVAGELLAGESMTTVRDHAVGLADDVRAGLGLPPGATPVVCLPDPQEALAARLAEAGIVAASRAGRLRLAFHLWNDAESVERLLAALSGVRA